MFGNKKKDPAPVANKKGIMPASTANALNSLVKGTTIEGTVASQSDIRVDGVIKGKLNCKAKVIIGPTGVIEGDVQCENAVIEGRFDGNLNVAQLLTVKESAEVHGDVITNKLVVQSGSVFNVTCRMGAQKSNGVVNRQQPVGNKVVHQESKPQQSIGQKASKQTS